MRPPPHRARSDGHRRVRHGPGRPADAVDGARAGRSARTGACLASSPSRDSATTPSRHDRATVTAPPYDVIDADERAALVARDPHNVVRHRPPGRRRAAGPLRRAAGTCSGWQDEGVLVGDPSRSFYVLPHGLHRRGRAGPATPPGCSGPSSCQPTRRGRHPPPRAHHAEGQERPPRPAAGHRANLSAVWGLSPAAGLTDLLRRRPTDADCADWTDADGVRTRALACRRPRRVDGHRRRGGGRPRRRSPTATTATRPRSPTATSARAADGDAGRRGRRGATYVVELGRGRADRVGPIHRLVVGLPDGFDLGGARSSRPSTSSPSSAGRRRRCRRHGAPRAHSPWCRPSGAGSAPRPEALGGRPRPRHQPPRRRARRRSPTTTSPTSTASTHVRGPVVDGRRPRPACSSARPPSPRSSSIAHGGERMPPKTTFFHPKPRTAWCSGPPTGSGPTRDRPSTAAARVSRGAQLDGPGGAAVQQGLRGRRARCAPAPRRAGGRRRVAYSGALDGPEHADRGRLVRAVGESRESMKARPVVGLVVDEQVASSPTSATSTIAQAPVGARARRPARRSAPKRIGSPCTSGIEHVVAVRLGRDASRTRRR